MISMCAFLPTRFDTSNEDSDNLPVLSFRVIIWRVDKGLDIIISESGTEALS